MGISRFLELEIIHEACRKFEKKMLLYQTMDHLSTDKRSWNMSRIRYKDTKPELIVRKLLREMGKRYRLNVSGLPGKLDIYIPRHRTAVFIHGCFWHQHKGCKRSSIPKSNLEYWIPKLQRNIKRFKTQQRELRMHDYRAIIVWECEVKDLTGLKRRLLINLE